MLISIIFVILYGFISVARDNSNFFVRSIESNVSNNLPQLPPVEENQQTRKINLGETISMDELGPIIINEDGTARRITNWNSLTKQEQSSTLRLIGLRNKKRIDNLKERNEIN